MGGLSMGGGIATRFTILHPQRVAALLIIDSASASGREMPQETRTMREELIRLAETKGMRAVAEYSLKNNPNISRTAAAGEEGGAHSAAVSIPRSRGLRSQHPNDPKRGV